MEKSVELINPNQKYYTRHDGNVYACKINKAVFSDEEYHCELLLADGTILNYHNHVISLSESAEGAISGKTIRIFLSDIEHYVLDVNGFEYSKCTSHLTVWWWNKNTFEAVETSKRHKMYIDFITGKCIVDKLEGYYYSEQECIDANKPQVFEFEEDIEPKEFEFDITETCKGKVKITATSREKAYEELQKRISEDGCNELFDGEHSVNIV